MRFEFDAELWRWEARVDDWYFVTVPQHASEAIAEIPRMRRGFASVRVEVRIGATLWRTSIFPGAGVSDGSGEYVLPIKRAVREREDLVPGLSFTVSLLVLDG